MLINSNKLWECWNCDRREPREPARPRRDRRGITINQARFTAPARYIRVITERRQDRAVEIGWKQYAFKLTLAKRWLVILTQTSSESAEFATNGSRTSRRVRAAIGAESR